MFITFSTEKIVDSELNGVLCYFPPSVILQGNARVFERNVDKAKVEVRIGVEDILAKAFQNFTL